MCSDINRWYFQIVSTIILSNSNYFRIFPDKNDLIQKFMVPLTGKIELIYNAIFEDIKKIVIDNNFNIKDLSNKIMVDFEKSLQKAIKKFSEYYY